jgi:hypothetical protein
MYFQYIILGIYYFIGIIFFLIKDYKHAKHISSENETYISLNNHNRILDRLIDGPLDDI